MNRAILEGAAMSPVRPAATNRTFLSYLEGVRGFFGLYILLAHLWVRMDKVRPGSFPLPPHFMEFGHCVVGIFIVISGYVLGLPVARSGQTFRGGLREFVKRRALRILPPYYAALVLAIPISLFAAPVFHEQLATTRLFITSVVLHLLMLHNLNNHLIWSIDNPMWSVAVECDIYLLFPLVLVPMARRFGFRAMILTAFAIGLVPTFVGALRQRGDFYYLSEASMWYIGLFALGYAVANMTVDKRPGVARRFGNWPWSLFAAGFVGALLVVVVMTPPQAETNGRYWFADILVGLATASQFLADAQARRRGQTTWFERFFLLRPMLFAGTFSYSLYLVHIPLIDLVMCFVRPGWTKLQVVCCAGVALCVALGTAYVFFRIVERPFMSAYRRRGDAESLRSDNVRLIPDPG